MLPGPAALPVGQPLPPLPPAPATQPVGPVAPPVPPVAPLSPMEGLPPEPGTPPPVPGMEPPPPGPKKKPMVLPSDLAHQIARAYADKAVELAASLATQSGPPDGAVPYSTRKQVRMWRARDPSVDVAALRAAGTSESEIMRQAYPLKSVLLALAGRTPLERVRYAQHMKRIAANYKDITYTPDIVDEPDETSDGEIVYDSVNESPPASAE